MWDLLIDPETDDLKIFDFNMGAKVGWEGNEDEDFKFRYEESRNDVKMAIFTFYEIVTRDLSFREKITSRLSLKPRWHLEGRIGSNIPTSASSRMSRLTSTGAS